MLRCKLEMADSTSNQKACSGWGSGKALLARGVINLVSYRRTVPGTCVSRVAGVRISVGGGGGACTLIL